MKKLKWGPRSKSYLNPKILEALLIELANAVLFEKGFDHSVIKSLRNEVEQNGTGSSSKLKFPDSFHNINKKEGRERSWAIDVIPYPFVCWPDPNKQRPEVYAKDLGRMYSLIAVYRATAIEKGIPIIVGADWDGDWNFRDQDFDDLPHIRLVSLDRLKPKVDESEYKEIVEKAAKFDQMKKICG